MEKLNLVIPMAGEGRRFKDQGYLVPKPLIELEGVPLFKRAVDSFEGLEVPIEYFFVVRQEHIEDCQIDQKILHYFPQAHVYPVEHTTRGAVETCMCAAADFQLDSPLVVLDCDLEFKCQHFIEFIQYEVNLPVEKRLGGGLISFFSQNARYSYAQTDEEGNVCRTAEKEVISSHALAGAYYFSSAEKFIDVARQLLARTNIGKPEYYLSLLYNLLLQQGKKVKLFDVNQYLSNGTPEELKREV